MSLKPRQISEIPEDTAEVAHAAFPNGNLYLQIRDELGTLYTDEDFAHLFPAVGQPCKDPWRLALVTVMQFIENLTDRQAADAVRSRIDWKYVLGLALKDPGFHFSILSDFRSRLINGSAEQILLDNLLEVFKARGWLKARQRQRTDATHVVAAIRTLTRIEMVGETLRQALNHLATVVPAWLQVRVPTEWYDRYSKSFEAYRMPKTEAALLDLAQQIGQDGWLLLQQVENETDLNWLSALPALTTLRHVWQQQYDCQETVIHWRDKDDLPASSAIISTPYDTQARYSRKRDTNWIGYKVHLTETCETDAPHFIIHVETTEATQPDNDVVNAIHADLEQQQLLPAEHVVDTAYMSSSNLVSSQQNQIDLLGPVNPDTSWQALAGAGFDSEHFKIDWETQTVRCPAGQTNATWRDYQNRHGDPVIQVRFPRQACLDCTLRPYCTTRLKDPRFLTLLPQAQYLAVQLARQRQTTEAFKTTYQVRAGIEGTISQAVHISGLRHTRYHGLPKTHLQHLATAAALNLLRSIAWLQEKPFAKTRISRFAALAA